MEGKEEIEVIMVVGQEMEAREVMEVMQVNIMF